MHSTPIRTAAIGDAERVVAVIAVAFVADPAMRWLYPESSAYLAGFPQLVRAFGEPALERGSAHEVADFAGAALWLPPGVAPDEARLGGVVEATVPPERASWLFDVLDELGRHRPSEPHWYLPFIGVDTPRQGQGLGSALLRHALAHVDRERKRAYLETANPANVPLYQRHGFEVAAKIERPPAPPVFAMVRQAR